jgi:NTP pyrophosphatase (non-canonical NTP hydrolase)
MNTATQEALDILQEECAEVIVEVSKCRRFGIDSVHYRTGEPHRTMLEQEIGDVLALVDILMDQGVLDTDALEAAKEAKRLKLIQWSRIFDEQGSLV